MLPPFVCGHPKSVNKNFSKQNKTIEQQTSQITTSIMTYLPMLWSEEFLLLQLRKGVFVKVGQPPAVDIHRQVAFVSRLKMHPSVVVFGGGGA